MLYNKHIMEQLALSVCLALDGPILEAALYVLHYWNLKAIRPTLVRLLEKYQGHPPAEAVPAARSPEHPGPARGRAALPPAPQLAALAAQVAGPPVAVG
ncbi:MAG: hypothetical protein WKG07_14530 [Hymenobacter sp.]